MESEDYYVMPMFATAQVRDLDASAAWYAALGFRRIFTMPGMTHLRRQRHQDILLVSNPDAAGGGPALALSFAAHEDDLVAVADRVRATGAGTVTGPVAQPWNADELICDDPDGHRIVLTKVRDRGRTQEQMLADTGGQLG